MKTIITVGSLFSGIGGLEKGLEDAQHDRYEFKTAWQVECDPYAQKVLAKHWPDCGRWDDVRTFPPYPTEDWRVDVICGGFPCQGISAANYRAKGLADERSGLWSEYRRLLFLLRPRYVVIENVPALAFRGLERVLCDLASLGFDAQWETIPAQSLGAPIIRERLFIVGSASSERCKANEIFSRCTPKTASEKQAARIREWPGKCQHSPSLPDRVRWCPDRSICRVADELPGRLDRYRGLGNAVVPQVAQWIGERILESL